MHRRVLQGSHKLGLGDRRDPVTRNCLRSKAARSMCQIANRPWVRSANLVGEKRNLSHGMIPLRTVRSIVNALLLRDWCLPRCFFLQATSCSRRLSTRQVTSHHRRRLLLVTSHLYAVRP